MNLFRKSGGFCNDLNQTTTSEQFYYKPGFAINYSTASSSNKSSDDAKNQVKKTPIMETHSSRFLKTLRSISKNKENKHNNSSANSSSCSSLKGYGVDAVTQTEDVSGNISGIIPLSKDKSFDCNENSINAPSNDFFTSTPNVSKNLSQEKSQYSLEIGSGSKENKRKSKFIKQTPVLIKEGSKSVTKSLNSVKKKVSSFKLFKKASEKNSTTFPTIPNIEKELEKCEKETQLSDEEGEVSEEQIESNYITPVRRIISIAEQKCDTKETPNKILEIPKFKVIVPKLEKVVGKIGQTPQNIATIRRTPKLMTSHFAKMESNISSGSDTSLEQDVIADRCRVAIECRNNFISFEGHGIQNKGRKKNY